jgi:hypothetical protein
VGNGSKWEQDQKAVAVVGGDLPELSPQDQMLRLKGLIRGKVKEAACKSPPQMYYVDEVGLERGLKGVGDSCLHDSD